MTVPTVKILEIPMYAGDITTATSLITDDCGNGKRENKCVSATGAHGLVFAYKNDEFKNTINRFYLNLPDGMPGVWIGRIKGANSMKRCYGPSFFENVLRQTAELPITHFFCGGNEGVAESLKIAVEEKFGNTNVVGTYCPPYLEVNNYDYTKIAKLIDNTRANIIWIGLSTPKQELFAIRLAGNTNSNFIITVGAAFDFHTNKVKQAPAFVQKIGMEWFFRLIMEPKRLYKRYLEIVPLFIFLNVKEFIKFAFRK
jgi:N-acetylglucosaminyldiphosphoundecaprenol N-acetyl-beta-D-mannosaminyltransferase